MWVCENFWPKKILSPKNVESEIFFSLNCLDLTCKSICLHNWKHISYIPLYLHTCIFIWWHAHLVTSLHICILENLYTFNLQYLNSCILAYFYTFTLPYLQTCIPSNLHVCVLPYLHTLCTWVFTNLFFHEFAYLYTYILAYLYYCIFTYLHTSFCEIFTDTAMTDTMTTITKISLQSKKD